MPLYEYKCSGCGQVFEIIQRFSDAPLTQHESCGGSVERLLSTSALQFKGSGFYINDYAKGGGSSPGKSSNGSDSKSEKSDSKSEKSDGKSEKKSDSSSSSSPAPSSTSTEKK